MRSSGDKTSANLGFEAKLWIILDRSVGAEVVHYNMMMRED